MQGLGGAIYRMLEHIQRENFSYHEVVDLPSWSMLPVQGLRAMIVAVVAIAVGYFSIGDQPPSAPDIVEPSGDLEHCR